MTMASFRFPALMVLALATVAAAPPPSTAGDGEAALAKRLNGYTAGRPVSCISARSVGNSETIAGTGVIYRTNGSRLYLNRPSGNLRELLPYRILITRSQSGRLCRSDIVDLASPTDRQPMASVTLGEFVPYDRAKPAAR